MIEEVAGFWKEVAKNILLTNVDYAALARDEKRNDRIFDDVLRSLEAGRQPVILTERRDHLDYLRGRFQHFTKNLVVLYGGMTTAERREAEER